MIQFLIPFSDWGFLALRVLVGLLLIPHGVSKLKDLKGTGAWFGSVGFKPGMFWGTLVALLEVVGGLALALGLLTQIISALFAIQFVVILLTLKLKAPLKEKELDILILAASLLFIVSGAGRISLDEYLRIILY
ncbi:MAG: DoxX family protein [Patescibacteria group bacterium]